LEIFYQFSNRLKFLRGRVMSNSVNHTIANFFEAE